MRTPAVSQALHALLPSIPASGKQFPTSLVAQTESLLALSRQRHPKLKAEEEIARAHVCTEIICNRLRVQLRLPAVTSGAGAPCKPTVYKKLYKFLDASLADASLGSLTPKGTKRSAAGTPKSNVSTTQKTPLQQLEADTPSKKRTVDKLPGQEFVGTIKTKPIKNAKESASDDGRAPAFVMPLIRLVCKQLGTPSIVPHVYTGCCIVLDLACLWPTEDGTIEDSDQKKHISGLVLALYLMVLTRMRRGKMTSTVYSQVSSKCLEAAELGTDGLAQVEEWIEELDAKGWCNGQDWWDSVPEDVIVLGQQQQNGTTRTDPVEKEDDDIEATFREERSQWLSLRKRDAEKEDPEGVLLPGLGTMLHADNDWNGEERRAEFQAWKNDVLKRLAAMEKSENKRGRAVAVS